MSKNLIKIGTCGFYTSQKRHLETLNAVEMNITFYRKWEPRRAYLLKEKAEKLHPGFVFTVKAFQGFTHPPNSFTWRRSHVPKEERSNFSPLLWTDAVLREDWFYEVVRILEAPVVLFQMPPSFKPSGENFERACEFFRKYPEYMGSRVGYVPDVVFEVRKWTPDERAKFFQTLRSCIKGFSIDEAIDPLLFGPPVASGGAVSAYFRLHKTLPGYWGSHSDEDLKRLRGLVEEQIEKHGKPVYVFFNNQYAYDDALRFLEILK